MNLIYRGQAYSSSNLPSVKAQSFTYRGQCYHSSASIAVAPKAKLSYRGVPYLQSESMVINGLTPAFN